MPTIILKYAIQQLQEMKNPSFVIIEDAKKAIVDFAESVEEANSKCMLADSHGVKCTFYESSLETVEKLREGTKNADLDPLKGDSIIIPNFDFNFSQE
ncbi:MAG: hypothetical protein IIA83_02175 [Thaumarchaeota archaeon]|nr:hypothetical protein [Nitrososphaerota archaeon]